MIWESEYWKEPLLKTATWLRRVRFSAKSRESTFVRIEKEIFIGFYSIRKLLDTYKVSDSTKQAEYDLAWYPNTKPVDYLNWHHLEKHYNLNKTQTHIRDIRFLCNQFIHSFLFLVDSEDRIDGFFVASDKVRNKLVYYVSINQVLQVFRLVGRDCPASGQWLRDPKTGKLKISAGSPNIGLQIDAAARRD